MSEFDRGQAKVFLSELFGDAEGYVAMAFKIGQDRVAHDPDRVHNDYFVPSQCKPEDRYGWAERKFAWPSERGPLLDEVTDRMDADTVKVMISPALFATPENRRATNVKYVSTVKLDYDARGERMDRGLLKDLLSLGPMIIKSGSPHSFHAYVRVDGLMIAAHDRLADALVDHFGADSKIRANDLLSLPGTFNPKNGQPVRLVTTRATRVWDSCAAVAQSLGIDLNRRPVRDDTPDVPTDVTLDQVDPARIRQLIRKANNWTGDASRANYFIVNSCRESGLDPGETFTFMVTRLRPGQYKFHGEDLADDIANIWSRKPTSKEEVMSDWEDPTPLVHTPNPLPTEALGQVLGPLVNHVAAAYQVPTDLVINAALPIITTAAHGRWQVKVNSTWTEPLCLATVSALASGERKSAVMNALSVPLAEVEAQAQKALSTLIKHEKREHQLRIDEVEKLKKQAHKDPEAEEAYLRAADKLDEHEPTTLPRWLADDTTPEKLVSLLAEQGGALGVISTEPTLFRILAGRYSSNKPNIESVLKATSGDPIRVDRLSRDPVSVAHTALSLGLCIQPDLLDGLDDGTFRGSGLLARFLYVVPPPRVGTRDQLERVIPEGVLARWKTAIQSIASKATASAEDDRSFVDFVDEFRVVSIDDRARAVLTRFRADLEPMLHPHSGELAGVADWGSKLPGAVVRIAAALTLLSDADGRVITADTMTNAARLAWAYVGHAQAAFGLMGGRNDDLNRADEVLRWLIAKRPSKPFTIRELHRGLAGRVWIKHSKRPTDTLEVVVDVLVQYGHVRKIEDDHTGKPGRPKSARYEINPRSIDNNDKNVVRRDSNVGVDDIDAKSRRVESIDKIDNTRAWTCSACKSDVRVIAEGRTVWLDPDHVEGCPQSAVAGKGERLVTRAEEYEYAE